MEINEKLLKPIIETKYLHVENTDRYRTILRFFYLQYEKYQYRIYQEDVFQELKKHEYFNDYTLEQCQQDLSSLVEWKNLTTIQDTRRVSTIEEFKNKKFRYELSEYTVEIERLVIRLENLEVEGASLEPSLLDRIRSSLSEIEEIVKQDNEKVASWWNQLNQNFVRLNQNYQDYMRDLNSVKAEEMMKTTEFLLFKDTLIQYLRGFVKTLQNNVLMIEDILNKTPNNIIEEITSKVIAYELSIPRIDSQLTYEQIKERIDGRFDAIKRWFIGLDGHLPESENVFNMSNEVIRKITRYATQISELSTGASRKDEYKKILQVFEECNTISQAHLLSANIFSFDAPMHFRGEFNRLTESVNSGVFEEEPLSIVVEPRVFNYRNKIEKNPIIDHSKQKEKLRKKIMRQIEREQKLIDKYIKNHQLDFGELPTIPKEVRSVLLQWISKGFETKERIGKTEDGKTFKLIEPKNQARCILRCEDGTFEMPRFKIEFMKGDE